MKNDKNSKEDKHLQICSNSSIFCYRIALSTLGVIALLIWTTSPDSRTEGFYFLIAILLLPLTVCLIVLCLILYYYIKYLKKTLKL